MTVRRVLIAMLFIVCAAIGATRALAGGDTPIAADALGIRVRSMPKHLCLSCRCKHTMSLYPIIRFRVGVMRLTPSLHLRLRRMGQCPPHFVQELYL